MMRVKIGKIPVSIDSPPILIAGPCVIESQDMLIETCEQIKQIAQQYGFPYILKSSFEKANRTSHDSFRGPGLDKGLKILAEAKKELSVPILTDIHLPEQADPVAQVADCLQIPAFLCRQSALIEAASATGRVVNIKKGQFIAPEAMRYAVNKAETAKAGGIMVTERGSMFGYSDLIVDMRSLVVMAREGVPVIFDATHSVQKPGSSKTGGDRSFVQPLAQAAAATGALSGIFIEVHPQPDKALSDAGSQLKLSNLVPLLDNLRKIFDVVKVSKTSAELVR